MEVIESKSQRGKPRLRRQAAALLRVSAMTVELALASGRSGAEEWERSRAS